MSGVSKKMMDSRPFELANKERERNGPFDLFVNLQAMREEQELTDLVMVAGPKERIACHKAVLAAFSPFIRNKIKENDSSLIEISTDNVKGVTLLLEYVYTGKKFRLTADNAKEFVDAVDLFETDSLKDLKFLRKMINIGDAIGVLRVAKNSKLSLLEKAAFDVLLNRFIDTTLYSTKASSKALLRDLDESELIEIISHDNLKISDDNTENDVFQAVVAWVKVDPSREASFFDVMEHVRLIECQNLNKVNEYELMNLTLKGQRLIRLARWDSRSSSRRQITLLTPRDMFSKIQQTLLHQLRELRKEEQMTDLVLEVEGKCIHCHQAVMGATIDFFKVMLTSGMKESREGRVELHQLDFDAVNLIVDAVYGVELVLDVDNVQGVLAASHQFALDTIQDKCFSFIYEHLDIENCVDVYFIGKKYNNPLLREDVGFFISGECGPIEDLHRFTHSDWTDLLLLSCFGLQNLQHLLQWAKKDPKRLPLLSSIFQPDYYIRIRPWETVKIQKVMEREQKMLGETNVQRLEIMFWGEDDYELDLGSEDESDDF